MAGPQGAPGRSPWPRAAPHIPLPARTAAEGAALRPLRAARRGRGGEGRGRARAGGGDGARAAAGPRRRRAGPGLRVPGSLARPLTPTALSPPPPPSCFGQATDLAPAHTTGCRLSGQRFGVSRLRAGCPIALLFAPASLEGLGE